MRRLTLLLLMVLVASALKSQPVTSTPALPNEQQSVTITFDATKGTAGLNNYTGDVYAHIGVITDKSVSTSDWKYVVSGWGVNIDKAKMTRLSANSYQLTLSPNVRSYFAVPAGEKILKIAMVFRSGVQVGGAYLEGKDTGGKDIFVDIYESGLNVAIQQPTKNKIVQPLTDLPFTATASEAATLDLYLNNQKVKSQTGTILNHTFNLPSGEYWARITAITPAKTVSDSVYFYVTGSQIQSPRPAGARKGITYLSSTSALLVLWAPYKQSVFVVGDFNNWQPSSAGRMKKDGDYFWLQIDNLVSGKEYAFQYLIDGTLRIADPYTNKTCDPWNDSYISAATYPGLLPYPAGKTEGIASVLQTSKTPYNWQVTNFKTPAPDSCLIYEMLVRDFDTNHSYSAAINHLNYLKDLNINVLELMPVNEFEGNSSWGYNPSFYFAPDKYYGPENELKRLIDEAHKRGIAVVIDLVLNHSYGQSPLVQMYQENYKPTAQNPWYNQQSNFTNPDAQWGYDFNHESSATRELVDSICSFWMSQYKVDGFRFDFTKGFSNNIKDASDTWGSKYDAQRIANLKRMASEIKKRKSDALIIFEHLAENSEEKELAEAGLGILLWGNSSGNCAEAAMGYHESGKSDFTWAAYTQRGWNKAAVVGYMESHDEERMAYRTINFGNSLGSYSTKDSTTAYKRAALTAALFMPIPGPKMIWQFEELGYDISIDYNGRLGEKPVKWNYVDNPYRTYLFRTLSKLFYLKKKYPIFQSGDFTYSLNGSTKSIKITKNSDHVIVVGNFGLATADVPVVYQKTGTWYEYFTASTVSVTNTSATLTLAPGEFRLYSTQDFTRPDISTDVEERPKPDSDFVFWPNPVSDYLNIGSQLPLSRISIYSITGSKVQERTWNNEVAGDKSLYLGNLSRGTYVVEVVAANGQKERRKIIKY